MVRLLARILGACVAIVVILGCILTSRVWFGDNQVGVEAASQYYFGKEPNQLDNAEAALLAGLIRAPSRYSPYKHPDRALSRRNEVIDTMVRDHAITEDQGRPQRRLVLGSQ
jgi:membrane peptidoglycan carboxypeptidase